MHHSLITRSEPDWFPLAQSQREIWFHQALHPESAAHNIGGYLDCPLPCDLDRLRLSWNLLTQRCEALRLEIRRRSDGTPEQRVLDQVCGDFPIIDLRGDPDAGGTARDWMATCMDEVIDPARAPLARLAVLLISDRRFILFLKGHHVVIDGWAFSLLTREMGTIYTALGRGEKLSLEPLSYRPFVEAQLAFAKSPAYSRNLDFWHAIYPSPPPRVLPKMSAVPTGESASGKTVLTLARPFYDRLEKCSGHSSVTAFHALLAAVHAALGGFRTQAGMAVGLPILNRSGARERSTPGLFAQALPFWVEPDAKATRAEALRQLAADLRRTYRYRRCPLGEINRAAGLSTSGQEQLFDVTLSFERHDYQSTLDGVAVRAVPLTNSMPALPLSMFVREFRPDEDVEVEFIYRRDCLTPEMAEWLKSRFESQLRAIVEDPEGTAGPERLLCQEESHLLESWNATARDSPGEETVVALFEEMADAHGGSLAVVDGRGEEWTYEQLNGRANQYARVLAEVSEPGEVIGVCLERGVDLLVVMLGILKSGRTHLPLSTEGSRARLEGILVDANVNLIVTSPATDPVGDTGTEKTLDIDIIRKEARGKSAANLEAAGAPESGAYCIFTSGSTGRPKGVILGHGGLANTVREFVEVFRQNPESRVLQFAACTFDASVIEILSTLCSGGCLHLPPADRALLPNADMIRFLESRRVTHAILPPAVLSILPRAGLPDLRVVMSAGDTCPSTVVEAWAPGRVFLNGYGPTECTICASTAECRPGDPHPSIGRPIGNTRIHIIDKRGREVPVGAAGEIAIAGAGVAAGYLNRPDLERASFQTLPHIGRVYRTGDLGRWRTEGHLEHLGRMDRQAKIRGSRVDPVEVESAIRSHPEVNDAVVVPCGEPPHQWLTAYFAPQSPVDEIRHHLSDRLPRHMIPSRFVPLAELPRSAHGKVDLSALPEATEVPENANAALPRDALDQKLQALWAKALEIDEPGIDDDFFALGGDSLRAAFLGNEIERELEMSIPMSVLLNQPTIRNVADELRAAAEGKAIEWPMILPLRPSGSATPFFCFPGANASGFYLQTLSAELSEEIPFYAFQWQGLEPGTRPLETVDELATLYVSEIQGVRPHGPYLVGGHSIGGIISFEVARRLEQAGEQVENVIIFDTTLTEAGDRPAGGVLQESSFLADLLKVCGWDPERAGEFAVDDSGRLADSPAVLSFMRRFLVSQSLLPFNCSDDQLQRVIAIWRAVAAAHDSYWPEGPVEAPITLFLAEDTPVGVPRQEQRSSGWGWDVWTRAGLHIEWVEGNHVQILSPPYVTQVAERLNGIVAGVSAPSARAVSS